jgi:hypothetical protein
MGLDTNGVKFLLSCKQKGVSFERTMMVGRQILNLELDELKACFDKFNKNISAEHLEKVYSGSDGYAEELLRYLGAKHIDSIDYSAYEGANILHDMNLPVEPILHKKFSTVLESGSLEHIFNFPVSIANCMNMVEVGGHFIIITPVNNIMGHGFYQFSPEVFYRVVNPQNGFEVERMIIFEYAPHQQWYQVADPQTVKQRVELMNSYATYLMIQAKRVSDLPILSVFPQQSDYVDAWEGKENYYTQHARDRDNHQRNQENVIRYKKLIKNFVPESLLEIYRAIIYSRKVKFDPKFYTKINPED